LVHRDGDQPDAPLSGPQRGVDGGGGAGCVDADVGVRAGAPSALVLWPCRPASRAVTSSREESMTAPAAAGSAVYRRPGRTSATVTCRALRSFSQITVPSPMGPAPNTITLSAVRAPTRFTQCRATAIGLVERGDLEGQGAGEDRHALARDGVLDEQVLAHAAQRAAAADDAGRRSLRVDDDSVAGRQAGDLGTYLDDLAGRLVPEPDRCGLPGPSGMPPICTKAASVPQMPQARARRSTSRGPGAGRWISATSIVPGAAVCTDFIISTGLSLPFWFWFWFW
jgi:hypothetical protein